MQIHELNTFNGDLDNAFTVVDNGSDTGKVNVGAIKNELESGLSGEIATLSARMDTFASLPSGSTSGDAELIDIRVGENGLTYSSAGDSVRGQVGDLFEIAKNELFASNNLVTSMVSGYYSSGYVDDDRFSHSNEIAVSPGDVLTIWNLHTYTSAQFPQLGAFFDSNDQPLVTILNTYKAQNDGNSPGMPFNIIVPANAGKIVINSDLKASDYPNGVPGAFYCYKRKEVNSSDGGKKLKFLAGVIRNSGSGWDFINDSGHEPLNLTGISVNSSGQIQVNYGFVASKVLSLVAAPDETFGGLYTIGASVGLNNSVFNIYTVPKTIGGMIQYLNGAWDIYDSSFTEATFNNGVLTLKHESLSGWAAKDLFNVSAVGRGCNVQLLDLGTDLIRLRFVDSNGNVITTLSENMRAYVTRQANARFIKANDVVDAGGNFWIFGVMEVAE